MSADELLQAALELPLPDRAKLAKQLLRSLDDSSDEGAQDAWLRVIARRAQELADGSVQPVDWEVARERIAQRLRERRR